MAHARPLAHLLRTHVDGSSSWSEQLDAAIDEALATAVETARRRWPEVVSEPAAFVAHVARHLPDAADPATALASMQLVELYLCDACARGDAAAVAELERDYVGSTKAALAGLRLPPDQREEALQRLRTDLLVADGERPGRIAQFAGRGSLAGWLRVVATRAALKQRRRERRGAVGADESLLDRLSERPGDPEIEQVQQRYRRQFETAMAHAFGRLTPEQRTLLRMYVIDDLTLAELGAVHGVDASTVSRRLSRVREQLLANARAKLMAELHMRRSEFESLMGVLKSQLHLSVHRLLEDEGDP